MASSVKYHKTYLKLHKEYEAYAYPIIKKALDDQTGAVADFVNEDNFDNIELYIQFLVQQKPLYSGLEQIYTKVGVSGATFSYDWIRNSVPKNKKDFIIDFFNAAWYEEMVNYFRLVGGTTVEGIDDTTRDKINNLLANILGQNLSRRDQAKLFQETLNDPEYNRARSLVIARTESTKAANYGINMGAESSDYEVQKFWINTKDKRTRRSHLLMTQDRIAINQPFIVGGIPMMYPGEVGAPAAEVVNCRCVMATEAIKDADGLPILKPRTPPYIRQGVQLPKLPTPIAQVAEQIKPTRSFVQATTLKEAKKQSVEIINNNTTINISQTKFSSNIDLDQLNDYNRQLYKLTNNYNLSPSYSKFVPVKLSFASTRRYYGFVKNDISANVVELNFGSAKQDLLNDFARTKGAVYKTEFGSIKFAGKSQVDPSNIRLATVTHEFAHFISVNKNQLIATYPKLRDYWTEIERLRSLYKSEISNLNYVKDYNKLNDVYLGDYASTNVNEFVAEAFTEYQLKSKPSKYALEVGKIIDKYFKK